MEGGRVSSYFEQLRMLGLVPEYHTQKVEGGVRLIAPKIDFYFFCARIAFLARAKFLRQPLVTYKTFGKNRFLILILICSKNTLVKIALNPPLLQL